MTEALGIDAGTLSLKLVYRNGSKIQHHFAEHSGEPLQTLNRLLEREQIDLKKTKTVVSGKYAPLLASACQLPVISPVSAILRNHQSASGKPVSYVVDIGSSGLSLAEITDGKLQRFETNSLCAAGTGAFLDQQMERLGLDYKSAGEIPILDNAPAIASRCSVFAKSDLIHRQQEGYQIPELWNGLSKGLAHAAFSTLFKGVPVKGNVLFIGGLANNKVFLHYFSALLNGHELILPESPVFYMAEALLNCAGTEAGRTPGVAAEINESGQQACEAVLKFTNTKALDHEHYRDQWGNEIDIYQLRNGEEPDVFTGADIGSTSTKAVLIDKYGNVRLGIYARTRGNPVDAFKRVLKGIDQVCRDRSVSLRIKGLGTTGSGRKLIGHFAGADLVKNEITAHLKGAVKEFPDVKTIFEIGGQDAKYIRVDNGWMKDANMNYVCAAGTGSFLEEQAGNLGIPLDDIPDRCRNEFPPTASHRCTVFMEQDANQLLTKGLGKGQVMASVLYAVCKNYLHRVVQHRPVEEPVLFLGATAKNKGLVEAFGNVLNKEILTSSYSHLMGAIGMAEMLREDTPVRTRFHGMHLKNVSVSIHEEVCSLCRNHCRITNMVSDDGNKMASWGYQCGREAADTPGIQTRHLDALSLLDGLVRKELPVHNPSGVLRYPKALHFFTYNPFWQHFFQALGIVLRPEEVAPGKAGQYTGSDTVTDCCFPMKKAVAEASACMEGNPDPVFLPYHIQDTPNPRTANSFFCPLSQAFPAIMASTLGLREVDTSGLIMPVVDFSKESKHNTEQLYKCLKSRYPVSRKRVRHAWDQAMEAFALHRKKLQREAGLSPGGHNGSGKPRFVVMGRSYNLLDEQLNLGLLRAIARHGYDVIPMDVLPVERADIPDGYEDMYWSYGQRIVAASEYVRKQEGLYPIFLTNFNCGPDSFLLGVFEENMQGKPSLILELDEHGGDGGYITRLEAFFDRANAHCTEKYRKEDFGEQKRSPSRIVRSLSGYTVYIPPMHPIATRLMSAGLRAYGIKSVPLRREDTATFSLGNACVRGSECMPAASTIGSFIHQIRQDRKDGKINGDAALFMPCTDGPCRFGQYVRLHDKILKEQQLEAAIISPNSDDHYNDIKGPVRMHLFRSLMVSDVLTKLGCRLRPYESEKGSIDALISKYTDQLELAFENRGDVTGLLKQLNEELPFYDLKLMKKPLVGVVGEIYVRNSPFANSSLVRRIEEAGGEAWVAPIMEWLHYTSDFGNNGGLFGRVQNKAANAFISYMENRYLGIFGKLLTDRKEPPVNEVKKSGAVYLPDSIEGESILTVGRAIAFIRQGAHLVVNVAPFGCMPGSISASVLKQVSNTYGTPVMTVFYDGETDFSEVLQAYIGGSKKVQA